MVSSGINKSPLFSDLPDADIDRIGKCGRIRMYAKGEMLIHMEDERTEVFFILEGAVRVFRVSRDGREQVLSYMKAGDILNLPTAFLEQKRSPAFAQSMTRISALAVRLDSLREMAAESPGIALWLLRELSRKLQYMTDLVHNLSLLDVRSRLARFLLEKHRAPDPATRWTHEKIALQIGTSREVVSRMLKALSKDGLVKLERGKLIIVNEEELSKVIHD